MVCRICSRASRRSSGDFDSQYAFSSDGSERLPTETTDLSILERDLGMGANPVSETQRSLENHESNLRPPNALNTRPLACYSTALLYLWSIGTFVPPEGATAEHWKELS